MTVVDSDVLIAHLRGHPHARGWLEQARQDGPVSISAVSVAEVVGGMRAPEKVEVRRLLRSLGCLPVTREIAERAGELGRTYRRSHAAISVADYLVAATALDSGHVLATLDVRHFPMFPGLEAPFQLEA